MSLNSSVLYNELVQIQREKLNITGCMSKIDACRINPPESGYLETFFDVSRDTVVKLNEQLTRDRLSSM